MDAKRAGERNQDKRLGEARLAFQQFHTRCFSFMRRDAVIVEKDIPYIIRRLPADGGAMGFMRADELCR
jgi:hypothetical protein